MMKTDENLTREKASQARDDRDQQRPQTFRDAAGERLQTSSLDGLVTPPAHTEPGFAAVEDTLSPDEPRMLTTSEARAATVRDVVASLSSSERRVYELAFGPALMSAREIAHELDDAVSYKTVQRALDKIKEQVCVALAATGLGQGDTDEETTT
jgi:hypothetical protein